MRVSSMDRVQPQALQELNEMLEGQSTSSAGQFRTMGGVKHTSDIMNLIESTIEAELMEGIKEVDEGLANQIQELMFVFDNLIDVDDRAIQVILREVASDVLILALKGADTALQEKIFRNMSKRAAELLRDDLEAKGPVRVSEVEDAQKEILSVARRLADDGEIMLGGGGEAMV